MNILQAIEGFTAGGSVPHIARPLNMPLEHPPKECVLAQAENHIDLVYKMQP